MLSKKVQLDQLSDSQKGHSSTYSSRYFKEDVPKYEIPEKGMPANAAYQLVHDECYLNCNPAMNLSSFVTTWMEPEAEKIIMENIQQNFIDHNQYPQTEEIHNRCVNMLARLFHSPNEAKSIGSATIGSSEAVVLAGAAAKFRWRNRMKETGKPHDKPNMIFGADVQICWEKFAKFFDVEMRMIPMTKDCFTLTPEQVEANIDENTIMVTAILGTTFTGQNDPIREINDLLIRVKQEKGWDIPLHVDGASGGFITPFTDPDFEWDFRLERVKSINVSGHKYGLVYPGIGWVLFREESDFPEELIFYVNYLGGQMPTMTINFSRGSAMVLAQYYNFLRLGREGYTEIMENCLSNSRYLSERLQKSGRFVLLNTTQALPIVGVCLKDDIKNYSVFDISNKVRERGWVVSAYTLPPDADEIAMLRVVVREHFSRDMADILTNDIDAACKYLETHAGKATAPVVPKGKKQRIHC
jgi:glutamate decarboxylase